MAIKLDGSVIAAQIRSEIREEIITLKEFGIVPSIAVVLVGDDPASKIYIRKKQEACESIGIKSVFHAMDYTDWNSSYDLISTLTALSIDPSIHGILLQLPLPKKYQAEQYEIFTYIDPKKDVDVFHPENIGLLVQGIPRFKPCTPHGIQQLLKRSGISVSGKHVVIINRSDVIGRPLSSMLIQDNDDYANATVTVCHNRSDQKAMKEITATADIIVVAVGQPNFLTREFVKPGAVVVDAGITRIQRGERTIVVGDVHPDVWDVAGWVSPVPKGLGPLTIVMLLKNTIEAAKLLSGLGSQTQRGKQ